MRIILKPLGAAIIVGTIGVLTLALFFLSKGKSAVATGNSSVPPVGGPSSTSQLPPTLAGLTEWQTKAGAQLDLMEVASPESENKHKIRGEKTESGRSPIDPKAKYRHALTGGWFGFDMKVHSQKPTLLVLRYWGDEPNLRIFDVVVDGKPIATEKLLHNIAPKYLDVGYALPAELTQGKSQVEVKLVGKMDEGATGWAGGIFLAKTYEMK